MSSQFLDEHGRLDPNMPAQVMRLHMGEMTAQEMRTARAAIAWANRCMESAALSGGNPVPDSTQIASPKTDGKLVTTTSLHVTTGKREDRTF